MCAVAKPQTAPSPELDLPGPKVNFPWAAKWTILGVILLTTLIVTLIINLNHSRNNISQTVNNISIDNGDSKINWDRYPTADIELKDTLTITNSGTYHLTGTLDSGAIIINAGTGVVRLILDNATIKNSNGPAIACYSADDLVIELKNDNFIEDGSKYSADYDEDVTSAIYSKADLTFEGGGNLNLIANYQDGIVSKDDLKFNGGTYTITSNDDGIRGKDSVYIVAGDFTINSKADAIKSTNETDAGKGFVLIENGNFTIASGDDGIHAIRTLIIKDGNINITKSYEGLEARVITINSGDISITASDDGINAGGGSDSSTDNRSNPGAFDVDISCAITIDGGNLYINAAGDGIDSNGYLYFNGGTTIVDGPTNNGNGALDAGAGISISGGEVIAVGSSGMAETLGTDSSVYNISVYFSSTLPKDTNIEIKDSANQTILSHTSAKTFSHLSAGTTNFQYGATYTIYLNGEKYQDFTITSVTTTLGNNTNQQMPPRR